jgi:hypothetical protein
VLLNQLPLPDLPGTLIPSLVFLHRVHPITRRQQTGEGARGPTTCPFNADHVPATSFNALYPYNSAINGVPGKGVGGY